MPLNLLDIVLITSGVIIITSVLVEYRYGRISRTIGMVFFGVGIALIGFTFFPQILVWIGKTFGLDRGADVLVYVSIVFLVYTVFVLLQKQEGHRQELSRLIRAIALENIKDGKK